MITEHFALKDDLELMLLKPSAAEDVDTLEDRKSLLQELGMETLLRHERKTAAQTERLWLAQQAYPEMSGSDLKAWCGFLPTVNRLDEYNFDSVPMEALQHIKTARQLKCFDEIIIWSPEGNSLFGALARSFNAGKEMLSKLVAKLDPMAVGVITDAYGVRHFFQIARWGEALLPFKQIKRHASRVRWQANTLLVVLPVLLVFFGIAAYVVGIIALGFLAMLLWTMAGVAACVVLTALAVIVFDL